MATRFLFGRWFQCTTVTSVDFLSGIGMFVEVLLVLVRVHPYRAWGSSFRINLGTPPEL
jgi:hypothetical protein